jgi:hypothetical protein
MRQNPRYRANLLGQYRQVMLVVTAGLGLLALLVVLGMATSFARYRRATDRAFVFHPGGAAIGIYAGSQPPMVSPATSSKPVQIR